MSAETSFVGKAGDAHQLLLDIVGLNPASVEFHSRMAESIDGAVQYHQPLGAGTGLLAGVSPLRSTPRRSASWEDSATVEPRLTFSSMSFSKMRHRCDTVIDDRPLSEKAAHPAYTTDGHNYIEWLIDAAKTSLDAVYQEHGFKDEKTPETLLYLYLRHALMLAITIRATSASHSCVSYSCTVQAMKPEPAFVHVAERRRFGEPVRRALQNGTTNHFGSPSILVSDYISAQHRALPKTQALDDQLSCLEVLAERFDREPGAMFAEHIDCCIYRYDAWLLGLVNYRLQKRAPAQRRRKQNGRTGVYLGAYAWLEDLRPSTARMNPRRNCRRTWRRTSRGPTPLLADPASNGGYIHAPSLPHAKRRRCCAADTWRTERQRIRALWPSIFLRTACGWPSRCSRASATARASAPCLAISLSGDCTTTPG